MIIPSSPPLELVRSARHPEHVIQRLLLSMTLGTPKNVIYRPRPKTKKPVRPILDKRRGN